MADLRRLAVTMLLTAAPVAMASAPRMRAQSRAAASAPIARSVAAASSSFGGLALPKAAARPCRAASRGQSLVTRALAIPGEILVRCWPCV